MCFYFPRLILICSVIRYDAGIPILLVVLGNMLTENTLLDVNQLMK